MKSIEIKYSIHFSKRIKIIVNKNECDIIEFIVQRDLLFRKMRKIK